MKVTVLSKPGCPQCDSAIEFLKSHEIEFNKKIVTKEELIELCGTRVRTYPQVIIDGNHIGTNFDLEDYIEDKYEPILQLTNSRFTTFPIKHDKLWSLLLQKAQGSFWTAEEIDFSHDMNDWISLTPDEKHFIKTILAFFASSDGIVFEKHQ